MTNPLHAEPLRPTAGPDGGVANPLTRRAPVRLTDDQPLGYDDLLPDTTYVHGRFEYLTDETAMPARVRGSLRFVPLAERVRHDRVQGSVGHLSTSLAAAHGGHIIAVSLGGFPSGPNLFPQSANFNVSAFARLERSWRQALAEGCEVAVDIALDVGDGVTPGVLVVTYWEDGQEETLVLLNEGHAQ
ncbi:MAG: DNA/RNA non-specific endonuclease [Actinomycetota bacterium]